MDSSKNDRGRCMTFLDQPITVYSKHTEPTNEILSPQLPQSPPQLHPPIPTHFLSQMTPTAHDSQMNALNSFETSVFKFGPESTFFNDLSNRKQQMADVTDVGALRHSQFVLRKNNKSVFDPLLPPPPGFSLSQHSIAQ